MQIRLAQCANSLGEISRTSRRVLRSKFHLPWMDSFLHCLIFASVTLLAACTTMPEWPVSVSTSELSPEQRSLVQREFESAASVPSGSDTDDTELGHVAKAALPHTTPNHAAPQETEFRVNEIRLWHANIALVSVTTTWHERGGTDSRGFYYGGSHSTDYIVIAKRTRFGWQAIQVYTWLFTSVVS